MPQIDVDLSLPTLPLPGLSQGVKASGRRYWTRSRSRETSVEGPAEVSRLRLRVHFFLPFAKTFYPPTDTFV